MLAAGNGEPVAEVVPESDAELGAGFYQTEESITAVSPEIAAGATADLSFGDLAADVVLRAIGVQRDLWPIKHHQQLRLVGVQPREQSIQGGETRTPPEDALEASPQLRPAAGCGIGAIGLEVAVEPPDEPADMALRGLVQVGERVQLMHQAFGVDPAQGVPADIKLAGIIAPASSLMMTVSGRKPCALTLPHSAPSVAIRTGSWMACSSMPAQGARDVMPSRARCACHAV